MTQQEKQELKEKLKNRFKEKGIIKLAIEMFRDTNFTDYDPEFVDIPHEVVETKIKS